MAAVIKRCTCSQPYQDKVHGRQLRVMNETTKGSARCTVCGTESGGGKLGKKK